MREGDAGQDDDDTEDQRKARASGERPGEYRSDGDEVQHAEVDERFGEKKIGGEADDRSTDGDFDNAQPERSRADVAYAGDEKADADDQQE